MGLIKKRNELDVNVRLKMLIYGQPGMGKTTLALSAPKPLLVDFDGGINRVDYDFIKDTVQAEKYEDILNLLNNEDLSDYETLVIDTGGKLLDSMAEYIIKLYPKMAKRNGSLTLDGFGQRKREFTALLKLIDSKKKNVVFVAHRQTEKNGEVTRYVPLFGGSNYDSLATELDLIGYLVADDRKRTITFDPTSESEGKNTCNMPSIVELPNLKDKNGNVVVENNFLEEQVFKAYRQRLIERSAEGEAYKKLIEQISEDIDTIDCVEGANHFKDNVATGYEHIGNSLAVARQKFIDHVAKLGLIYNKEKKVYEQPAEQESEQK
jgi:adenylate kinase family enzyme